MSEFDWKPSQTVQNNAKRGKELSEKWGRGGTDVGKATADLIIEGRVPAERLGRVVSYLERAETYNAPGEEEDDGGPTAGTIAYLLWGGKTALSEARAAYEKYEKRTDRRCDSLESFEIKRMEQTKEGFLDIWGVAALVGPLEYPELNRTEFVTEDALRDSIESLKDAVVTLLHPPPGEVTPETYKEYSVGHVAEAAYVDGEQRVRLRVTDSAAIAAILSKKAIELSTGYDVRTDEDNNQIWRYNNHVAIVPEGRAGERASLRVDQRSAMEHDEMKERLDAMMQKMDEMKEDMESMRKERDAAAARADAMEKKLDEYMSKKDEESEEDEKRGDSLRLANELIALRAVAKEHDVEVRNDMMPMDIKRSILTKNGLNLTDEKSDEYIEAAFEVMSNYKPKETRTDAAWHLSNANKQDFSAAPKVSTSDLWIKRMSGSAQTKDKE